MEFNDVTDEVKESYENIRCDCIRLPEGRIITRVDSLVCYKYDIADGVIYQKSAGVCKRRKRTKKAKKLKLLPNYPLNKVYKTLKNYAEDFCGYLYYEEQDAFGYYTNPDAIFDWCEIGGRWPFQFLVKTTAEQIIKGDYDWVSDDYTKKAPDGYKWVAGARKADIEWDLMKKLKSEETACIFAMYESINKPKNKDNGKDLDKLLYIPGETYDEWLKRRNIIPEQIYSDLAYSYIQDGGYYNHDSFYGETDDNGVDMWEKMVKDYIDSISDDDIIVTVDCHI